MGKKGSWLSAIKRVFTSGSKDKLADEFEKKNPKEKKKRGIPLFRKPSSIEKILGEAELEHYPIDFRPLSVFEQPSTPSFVPSRAATPLQDDRIPTPPQVTVSPPRVSSSRSLASPTTLQRLGSSTKGSTSQRIVSPPRTATPPERTVTVSPPGKDACSSQAAIPSNAAVPPPRIASPRLVHRPRPEPTLRYQHVCATRIQSAYRGYKARKSYRGLRGLVRLQSVVKGQSVKRQTANAMKSMQLLVRVQTQIQSRRIQTLENRALQLQALESQNLNQASENGNLDGWDDSRLTKDEADSRTQRKSEAVIKRERAMAYAYSRQTWKVNPKTPQEVLMDIRSSGGFPWWWSWLDRQANPSTMPTKPSESPAVKNHPSTPPRATTTSPVIRNSSNRGYSNSGTSTPRSTRSTAMPTRMKLSLTPPSRFMRSRPGGASSPFKDDDSLMSCPPFSVPRYMEPTASAIAKAKGGSGVSPDVQSQRRVSFPLAQGVGPFKWNRRGSLSSANTTPSREGGSRKPLERKPSMQSLGNMSVDSTVSMPAAMGRKPFNRFV